MTNTPPIISPGHRIRIHRRATRVGAFEVFEAAHVALRTLLAFSQPVNCIFWPIGMLNWLVAASKLHKHRQTCDTAEWLFYSFLILCPGLIQVRKSFLMGLYMGAFIWGEAYTWTTFWVCDNCIYCSFI